MRLSVVADVEKDASARVGRLCAIRDTRIRTRSFRRTRETKFCRSRPSSDGAQPSTTSFREKAVLHTLHRRSNEAGWCRDDAEHVDRFGTALKETRRARLVLHPEGAPAGCSHTTPSPQERKHSSPLVAHQHHSTEMIVYQQAKCTGGGYDGLTTSARASSRQRFLSQHPRQAHEIRDAH
jgi:hypothetical protein